MQVTPGRKEMRLFLTASLLVTATAVYAQSADLSDKLCIASAARQLPVIQGLITMASRTKEVKPQDPAAKIVEIDIRAAGQDVTYAFACAFNDKVAVTVPLGMVK